MVHSNFVTRWRRGGEKFYQKTGFWKVLSHFQTLSNFLPNQSGKVKFHYGELVGDQNMTPQILVEIDSK